MDRIRIRGGRSLSGTIPISGAKNSALTLIPCALLTDEPMTLRNLPRLADIDGFQHLMNQFGYLDIDEPLIFDLNDLGLIGHEFLLLMANQITRMIKAFLVF